MPITIYIDMRNAMEDFAYEDVLDKTKMHPFDFLDWFNSLTEKKQEAYRRAVQEFFPDDKSSR